MRRFCIIIIALCLASGSVKAQDSKWSFNVDGWTTNYFTTLIYDLASTAVKHFAFHENERDSLMAERLFPAADFVFPVGMGKEGFNDVNNIYGPYKRAFSNPFKHIGDWCVGADASFKPSFIGFYGGVYFKSQEVIFKATDDNLRGFYFQPRAGIILGGEEHALEAGVFYDVVTGCSGTAVPGIVAQGAVLPAAQKEMLKGGLGLDFALSFATSKDKKRKTLLRFSMPLHNFFDTDYPGQKDLKRKVGYILLSRRFML